MNLIIHLIWTLLILAALSLRQVVTPVDMFLSLAFGVGIDLDHCYYLVRGSGPHLRLFGDSLRKFIDRSKNPVSAPRYHTFVHEFGGMAVVLTLSALLSLTYSSFTAWLIIAVYVSHVVLDALSVRMMPLSPFSHKEIYLGLIPAGSRREKWFLVLSLVAFLALFALVIGV